MQTDDRGRPYVEVAFSRAYPAANIAQVVRVREPSARDLRQAEKRAGGDTGMGFMCELAALCIEAPTVDDLSAGDFTLVAKALEGFLSPAALSGSAG